MLRTFSSLQLVFIAITIICLMAKCARTVQMHDVEEKVKAEETSPSQQHTGKLEL
jgi:hypothetical protein